METYHPPKEVEEKEDNSELPEEEFISEKWLLEKIDSFIPLIKEKWPSIAQKTLETTIEEQNQNLKQTIENQELMIAQVERLQKENMAAQNEVTDIRKKWSRHSLDVLSIRKPQLIQNIINRGTKAVLNDLKQITDENQFDQDVFVPDPVTS